MGSTATPPEDLSWKEVAQLGLVYAKIPIALLLVEAFYWFLTMPTDTLGPIQVSEAWLWNEIGNALFGAGSHTLSTNNGWLTRIEFNHPSFPGAMNTVSLYVSDECAGVHEMIFISTLVAMTDGVSQKIKIKAIVVMCTLVYILNLARLIVFYPIALEGCLANPDQASCLYGMWEFHTAVYEWGFLLVLISMWVLWFWKVGGPSRAMDKSLAGADKWRIITRKKWNYKHIVAITFAVIFIISAAHNVTSNEEAMKAKETLDDCELWDSVSAQCGNARDRWDDAIGYAWSLAALALVVAALTIFTIEKPNSDGKWPSEVERIAKEEDRLELLKEQKIEAAIQEKERVHSLKKSGSWKKRRSLNGTEEE
jgi:exosortase/archaeosortase family protein